MGARPAPSHPSSKILMKSPLQPCHEIPASEVDLDQLVHLSGASPKSISSPWQSIPLLQAIEGRKGYLTSLNMAAVTLYGLLCQDQQVQAYIEAGRDVVLRDRAKGKLPAFPDKPKPQAVLALQHILHSCAHIASSPLVQTDAGPERRNYVAVPMDRNEFVQGQAYGHLTYETFKAMVLALSVATPPGSNHSWLEYIPPKMAKIDPRRTRIGPNQSFRTWMLKAGLIFPKHPYGPKTSWPRAKTSLLWLRVKPASEEVQDGEIRVPLFRPLQGDELILPAINAQLTKMQIACPFPDYAFYDRHYDYTAGKSKLRLSGNKQLYRSFSYQDGRGGRLYGSWVQGVPGSLRRYLTINGRPTVELDYANMQLVLLYAMHGLPVPDGDLYDLPGQTRSIMKLVLTVSVGAKTKADALNAIRRKLQDDNTASRHVGNAERYYRAFWNHHSAVYPHHVKSNQVWADLQYADSQIALRVLRYMLEQGVSAIPIHDSFIVQDKDAVQLEHAMIKAFQDYWPGNAIGIK